MSAPISLDALLQRLAGAPEGAITVVTPNRRLASWLERGYDQFQAGAGRTAWGRADIVSFRAFVEREWRLLTYRASTAPPRLITDYANQAIWEGVIRDAMRDDAPLMNLAKAAREAKLAWRLSMAWGLAPEFEREALGVDAQMFCDWLNRYETRCGELGVVAAEALPDLLGRRVLESRGAFDGRTIIALEFDLSTVQQESLWLAYQGAGAMVSHHHWMRTPAGQVSRHVFPTPEDEFAACATWVRSQLESVPGTKVGVVAPDLARIKSPLARALSGSLSPQRLAHANIDGPCEPASVNFSMGEPLGNHSMVRDALHLLAAACLPGEKAPATRWSALLRSPWTAHGASEAAARALLDAETLPSLPLDLTLAEWLLATARPASKRRVAACPAWFSALRAAQAAAQGPASRSAQSWVSAFGAILHAWGFPGELSLDSHTFQVRDAFRSALDELTRASINRARISSQDALSLLHRIVSETPFQSESPSDQPPQVQVLGVLESAGLQFDALWVMGLDEDHWPLSAKPNPFLPSMAQRRLPIPETSKEASLNVDRHLVHAWRAAATHVVFSHAIHAADRDDDRKLNASTLIQDIPATPFPMVVKPGLAQQIASSAAAEKLVDVPPPGLVKGTFVRGGASVLRDQAACPFRAFALHRLSASSLESPRTQPDAVARGNVLHRALSLLWRDLQGSTGLERTDVAASIGRAVDVALADAARQYPLSFPGRLATLEQARLCQLLEMWIALERDREGFLVVGNEMTRDVELEGLAMRLRLDRVDQLPDGTVALIDYKSGEAKPSAWIGDRPDEPQLPLYFATTEEDVSAVVFARVKPGKAMGFAGVSTSNAVLPGVKPPEEQPVFRKAGYSSWLVLAGRWNDSVAALARAFIFGDAVIDPKGQGAACQRCQLHALCRIAESEEASAREMAMEENR